MSDENRRIDEAEHDVAIGGGEKMPLDDAGTAKYATTGDVKNYVIAQIAAIAAAQGVTLATDGVYLLSSGTIKPVNAQTLAAAVLDYGFSLEGVTTVTGTDLIGVKSGDSKKTVTATQLKDWITANSASIPWSGLSETQYDGSGTIDLADDDYLVFRDTSASEDRKIKVMSYRRYQQEAFRAYVKSLSGLTGSDYVRGTDLVYLVHTDGSGNESAIKATVSQLLSAAGVSNPVTGPSATTENKVPQWDSSTRTLKNGLGVVTTIGASPSDTNLATESAVATAIQNIPQAGLVNTTSDQTIGGTKTFTLQPVVPNPVQDGHAANKAYVIQQTTGQFVMLTGDQSIAGIKTFTASPSVPEPTTDGGATPKKYVEENFVTLGTTQTVTGAKTFSVAPLVTEEIAADDASGKTASTGWIATKLAAWWTAVKAAAQSVSGAWTFTASPSVPTPTASTGAANKAYVDGNAVMLTGDQSVAGVKTFAASPVLPNAAPTAPYQAATKKYVDDTLVEAANCVLLDTDQSIGGTKTFTTYPVLPSTPPTSDRQAATKKYVDDNSSASSCVRLTGNQTVAGVKTFENAPITPNNVTADGEAINLYILRTRLGNYVTRYDNDLIAGTKTFSSFPVLPSTAPTTDYQAATKKYVDDTLVALDQAVLLSTNQTINGVKTFTSSPLIPTIGFDDYSDRAASTSYVRVAIAAYANRVHEPKFPVITKTVTNNAVTLSDAAINLLTLSVGSTVTATMPTPTADPKHAGDPTHAENFSRSFILVLDVTGTGSGTVTLNLDSTCTYVAESGDVFAITPGVTHIIGFTEDGKVANRFLVSRRTFTNSGTAFTGVLA